ncbi:GbpC/Spa domain-containing protein [Parvimonas micra]|uniref:Gram-positive cocci surface proteins LPxTG domain-containing protein n=1 Tax=Parvimonas micra TaxID=33033 RepID=A0A0B4RZB2_9FIRM|nr:GbpC/Spa domain-containing protein [Parvimonas micra]AIZ35927.1 hypothetical protein NW74_00310 [Parvimonas micra]
MKKREIINKIVSMLMIFALVVPIASQAYAADPTRGVEVNADHSKLDQAVQEAKDSGVDVSKETTQDKGTASSNSEADAKLAAVKADYENQIQKIKAAKLDMDNYNAKKKEYDKLKKKYDEDLAKYKIAKKKYEEELKAYNKALEEWKNHKDEEGYLPESIDQPLVFKNEPNARASINTKPYRSTDWVNEVKNMGYPVGSEIYNIALKYNKYSLDEGAYRVFLEKGKTVSAVYSNLQNSTYNGKKIIRVEFKFTLKKLTAAGKNKIPAIIYYEPTKTINYSDLGANAEIDFEVVFYGEDGKPIDVTNSLISFASLNRDLDNGVDRSEYVQGFNGRYIKINGSSIEAQNGKAISSIKSNEHKSHGSRFEVSEWDKHNSTKSWYGAIVGKAEGKTVKVTFGAMNRKAIWFAFNSDIKSYGVPIKPTEPEKPTPPKEPQKPETNVSYHYDIFYVKSQVEKKVTNANNQDINNKVVDTGSVVNFELKTSDFPKHHEEIKSLVFTDTLPEGYQLDLEGTKANSPDYDVEYNGGTRLLKFTAKTSLLNEINRDLTKDAKVPSPKITGKVTKEGTKYENKFKISINNDYNVESDPVRVFTPKKPVKDVFDSQNTQVSIDKQTVKAGQELLYKVTYKNTTGKEQKVVIKDKIPEYTTYVENSADNGGVYDNGVITWTKEKVAADETFEVTFKVKVKDDVNGETIKNKANVLEGNNEYETNETTNPTSTKPKKDVFDSSAPQVSIDKQTVKAGQELLYKVTYKNTTGKEQKVVIKDKIPEYTTYVENSADNGGVYDNGVITWTKEKVAADETFEVTFKVKVKDDVSGEVIKNKANVLEGNNKYETNETTNPTSTKPKKDVFDSQDDIAPNQLFRDDRISIDGNEVKAGQELLYKVTYKNTTGKEQKVVIKDKIPEHTTYVEGSADNDGVYDNGVITWTKEKVAADETFEVTFKVKVKDDVNGETIKNKANVLEGNNEYETNETTNPTSTKPKKDVFDSQDTQVSIDKQTVKAGQELLYKVTYKNTTGKEQKVVIKDKIPEYTTYVENSADNGGVYDNGVITWTKEKVAADETFEVTFKVKVKDDVNGETIKNKANVLEGNNEYETNETTNPTSTKPKKDVFDSSAPQVSIDKQTVKAGQELLYKVTYKNTTGKEQKVVIKDKIPEYTTYVENSADNGGVYDNGVITWTKEKVAADETFEVTFKVKVKDDVNGETIKNKANVLEGNNEYETNETTNPTSTKPKKDVFDSSAPQVSIDKQTVKAGQELLYKVTYKNTTGKEQKVVIKDKIPEYTTYVENSADNGGVYDNGVITWTKEKVAADETFEVTFKVKVKDDVNGETIKNKANVLEGNNEYETNETTNPTSTKPKKDVFDSSAPQVSIDKQTVKAGQELLYKVTYKNTTGKEQKVVIKDKIPEYTTYVENSADNGGVYDNGVITWTKEKVAADETFEVTFKVKVKDDVNGETIKNKANVLEGNNEYETNETTNPTSTKPKKDVFDSSAPQVSIDKQTVKAGQELLYKVTYKNTTGKEQKVVIKDKIPEYTTYVENSADNGGVYDNGVITWTKEKVAADETFEVTFKVKVKDDVNGETIKNKANVLEGNNEYETNETTNPTSTKPKKDVFDSQDDIAPNQLFRDDRISIDGNEVKAGQELLYKVTYKNTTGKEQKVVIKDKIPEYTTYVENSADNGGVYDNGVITWTKEKVAPGETFEVTFKVKVDENVNGEVIKNKANVLEGNNNYETNETTNPTPKKPGKEIPRTGFGANTALYTALLGLSTVALGGFRIRYKKKNNK